MQAAVGSDAGSATEERRKAVAALHRGVPRSRMVDYGMAKSDVAVLGAITGEQADWDDTAVELAELRLEAADRLMALSQRCRAAQEIEWAAAALTVGQLAFNHDVSRKAELFSRSVSLFRQAASLAGGFHHRSTFATDHGKIYGWIFPLAAARGCVIIVGGLSGWGAAYFGMARAFNLRGLAAILLEMPGQGETRLVSGLYLCRAVMSAIAPVIAEALRHAPRVGIMGNSFGGLIAAHCAADQPRIAACCINGAVPAAAVPEFRTAREQMEAAFGETGAALERRVADFAFDATETPIAAPVLILEGGADPLVPLGAQAGFVGDRQGPGTTVMTWPDGEHTIYNHAADRDALVSAWFVDQLDGERAQ